MCINPGQPGVVGGKGHGALVNIETHRLKGRVAHHLLQRGGAGALERAGRHKGIPLRRKAAAQARRDVQSLHGRLNAQRAAAAERVLHGAVRVDAA